MRLRASPLRNLRAAALLAGLAAALVFLNSLGNRFAYDDNHIIAENEAIHSLETLPGALVEPYWPGEYGEGLGLWRPVVTAVYGTQWALWNGDPTGFHLVNLLLHAAVTALVVLLLGQILPVAGALAGGLVFALHAVHVEAVANVVGLAEILAALFFLAACLLVLRGKERLGPGRLVAVLLLFALGVLTKESAVTLPGVVLLLDSTRRDLTPGDLGRYLRNRWPLYGGMVLLLGLILWARHSILGSVASPFAPLGAHLLEEEIPRIWTVATTWPHIIRLLFFPLELVSDYGPAVVPIALGWNAVNVVGAGMVLGFLVLALLTWRRGPMGPDRLSSRAVGWGVVWFVITLSPTSNLLFLSGILLSERTLYLPSVGFAAAVGWGVLRLHRERPRPAVALLVVFLAFLGVRSWTRTPTWKDNMEVFNTLVLNHPESGRAQWVLGDTYFQVGRASDGLKAYRVAIGILGGHYTLLGGIGNRLMNAGYADAAEHLLTHAWRSRPEFAYAPGLLANLYLKQERYAEAARAARASVDADSTDAVQHHILARALRAMGRVEEAIEARRGAIRHGEGDRWQQWGWLAELRLMAGDTAGARRAVDSARARATTEDALVGVDSLAAGLGIEPESDATGVGGGGGPGAGSGASPGSSGDGVGGGSGAPPGTSPDATGVGGVAHTGVPPDAWRDGCEAGGGGN